ncbi:MAG: hypothetical protein R3348_06965 [Xanthomonadales bacterium]|nr:hypothetical protein [Xanthomonadales bacterium]
MLRNWLRKRQTPRYGRAADRDQVVAQKQLMLAYRQLADDVSMDLRDVGWSVYSQHEEDGLLLYVFARIGVEHYRCVDMCVGTGLESNTANLIINHRWTGLLIDGDEDNLAIARSFYESRRETRYWPPELRHAWLTRDNVNDVIGRAGCSGEIDLLSLDMDGVDYWIWKALDVVQPRVVVAEYNHLLGPEARLSVPYSDHFVAEFTEYGSDYAGASLGAFIDLAASRGMRFVGTNAIGTNAIFVREDLAGVMLPEADPHDAFLHPRAQFGLENRFPAVSDKEWVEVQP